MVVGREREIERDEDDRRGLVGEMKAVTLAIWTSNRRDNDKSIFIEGDDQVVKKAK